MKIHQSVKLASSEQTLQRGQNKVLGNETMDSDEYLLLECQSWK